MQLSARNQIPARVTSINSGEAIANVKLQAGGVRLVASIRVEAAHGEPPPARLPQHPQVPRYPGRAIGSSVTGPLELQ